MGNKYVKLKVEDEKFVGEMQEIVKECGGIEMLKKIIQTFKAMLEMKLSSKLKIQGKNEELVFKRIK